MGCASGASVFPYYDAGLSGGEPGAPKQYSGICHSFCTLYGRRDAGGDVVVDRVVKI